MQGHIFVLFCRERQMHGRLSFITLLLLLFSTFPAPARGSTSEQVRAARASFEPSGPAYPPNTTPQTNTIVPPSAGRVFYDIAYELASSEDVLGPDLEQAIIFLKAAMELDNNIPAIRPLLIDLASRDIEKDYAALVDRLLTEYVDEFADLEIARRGVNYLLQRQNSLEGKEKILEKMLGTIANHNIVFGSELATQLGLLKAEEPDLKAAEYYLKQAYQNNPYNQLAFSKLEELAPDQVGPVLSLEHLRLGLRENPADMDASLAFAQRAEELQLYDTAAAAYEYCTDLFAYLYPNEVLSARIYIPWAISCYNTKTNQLKCLQIAERIRQTGKFDLRLEAIAGRAAIKVGKDELATQIIQDAEKKATKILAGNQQQTATSQAGSAQQVTAAQMAWFYCFVVPLEKQALDWANKAFSAEQQSPVAASLAAYALVLNKEYDNAKPLINKFEHNQISDLALGRIQLAEGQTTLAAESLRSSIARDPGSFAAEWAKGLLSQMGQKYVPPVDPNSILTDLKKAFGQAIVPAFTRPEQILSVELDIRDRELTYGSELDGVIAVTNNSSEPLVISNQGLFTGSIRLDAEVTGELRETIPELISRRIQTTLLVEPGRSWLIPLRLVTGELRKILLDHPQASLNIEFILYLDPVRTGDNRITNRLTYIAPRKAGVQRPGLQLNTQILNDRLNLLISQGQVIQKIQTALLFTGLLKEEYAFSGRTPPYRLMYTNGMVDLLKTGLAHQYGLLLNPAESDWIVKVYTMADMISLPLDYTLTKAVSENLNNPQWPVRLAAVYLLAKNPDGGFNKVLDWLAQNDANNYVRDMAVSLNESSLSGSPMF
jgi:hypothetical protein